MGEKLGLMEIFLIKNARLLKTNSTHAYGVYFGEFVILDARSNTLVETVTL